MSKVSVVIPSSGSITQLNNLLQSIQQQRDCEIEIIVVRDALAADVQDKILPISDFRLLRAEQAGVNNARNTGLLYASGEWIYFLDDDCVLPSASHIVNALEEATANHYDYLAGYYVDAHKAKMVSRIYNALCRLWLAANTNKRQIPFLGGNLLIQKMRLGEKRFNKDIAYGGAEISLINQLAGLHGALSQQLAVIHDLQIDWPGLLRKSWRQGRSPDRLAGAKNLPLVGRLILKQLFNDSPIVSLGIGTYLAVGFVGKMFLNLGQSLKRFKRL